MKTTALYSGNSLAVRFANGRRTTLRTATVIACLMAAGLVGGSPVVWAGGAMGRSAGGGMRRSSGGGGSMSRGSRAMGSGLSRSHGGGNSPARIGNLSGTHFNNNVGMPKGRSVAQQPVNQPKVHSNNRPYIPYFRSGPNSPWMPYGTFNNYDDAIRATQQFKGLGYESFMRNR